MICPECNKEVNDNAKMCEFCKFDLEMYKQAYNRIYAEKLGELNATENAKNQPQIIYTSTTQNVGVHKPRCPYCNSENLTKITSFDKVVNIAMFGLLGNKRKYQWHCNNCKTNW